MKEEKEEKEEEEKEEEEEKAIEVAMEADLNLNLMKKNFLLLNNRKFR